MRQGGDGLRICMGRWCFTGVGDKVCRITTRLMFCRRSSLLWLDQLRRFNSDRAGRFAAGCGRSPAIKCGTISGVVQGRLWLPEVRRPGRRWRKLQRGCQTILTSTQTATSCDRCIDAELNWFAASSKIARGRFSGKQLLKSVQRVRSRSNSELPRMR